MADKNTADIGFENKYGMQPVCFVAIWMRQNIRMSFWD